MITSTAIGLAERGLLPLPGLRLGIRGLLAARLREVTRGGGPGLADRVSGGPIAVTTDAANAQHYEVPPEFFELVLGPRLKYSSALWPAGTADLEEAEVRMLEVTCDRADLVDGQQVLELGCGWGSLTLHMAHAYPRSRITAVSNSSAQRRFIEARAPSNVRVITADVNGFEPGERFDRVVSVEMFEHVRNHAELLRRIRSWLRPDGRLFVHVFCHRDHAYPFETDGPANWMGRYFFTGGVMPSLGLLPSHDDSMGLEEQWEVGGQHYSRTARAWRENLEARRAEVLEIFRTAYGSDAQRWYHRWRLFFLACEELFGYRDGSEWLVAHYRFAPK